MNILLINKFYYLSGGAERYVFDWEQLLREHGHDVRVFAMQHPRNRPCAQERYFVDHVEFRPDLSITSKARAALHSVWSRQARRNIRALLRNEGRPDVVHLHSFSYQLTPSILGPIRDAGIPVVQTCHEYSPICANQRLYNQRTHAICEACLHHGPLAPLWTRCLKGSFAASATACAASLADRFLAHSRNRIARFITPSRFMKTMLERGGIPPDRIAAIPHFIAAEAIQSSNQPGDYLLFFGRLVEQKGIWTFLNAARQCADIPCKILGGGPLENEVRRRVARHGLSHVEVLGHKEGEELWTLVRGSRAVVVPSEWYEPFGLVILEAMATGRAVVVSDLAGPAELVAPDQNGFRFPPGDSDSLAHIMTRLWRNPDRAVTMGQSGREKVLSEFRPDDHYQRVMKQFEDVIT